ncbi:MAG: helix-turn-helix domain-containing protein [Clostridia bacterium]|nr:helix-turn-helix domain-containing protein [Clostridia bacterium]
MDQTKTGRFIAELRREKEMTQRQLADRLNISDKTVSKWETGKGMPEISLMIPLCELLGISVSELLSGERLSADLYKKKAEENIMDLVKEREESKRKIALMAVTLVITMLASVTLFLVSGIFEMSVALRVILLVIGFVVLVGGIFVAASLEMSAGTYECKHCGTRFVPTFGAYLAGPHTLTRRYLKCPECGKKGYFKRRLTH